MFKSPLLLLGFLLACTGAKSQHLYYKFVSVENINQFADTSHKIKFVKKDTSSADYTNYIKYALKFYPKIEYGRIDVIVKPAKNPARVKPTFLCLFQPPQNRRYKIYLSSGTKSELDSVILKNLDVNSQMGVIARQISQVEDLSTSGFFDIVGWYFKQLSRKSKKKLAHETEQKALEAGFGYQMLSLSRDEDEKLQIEKWKNASAYEYYAKHYKNIYLTPDVIRNFISDLPIYVSQDFK